MSLFALALACFQGVASAGEPERATPPKGAKTWTILSAGGAHGEEQVWTDKDGARWARMQILLRGLVYDMDQATTGRAAGTNR